MVNKAPNIREELNILAFKRRHVILNGGVMVFYEPRKKKIEFKKKKKRRRTFQRGILSKIQKVKHFLFLTFSAL